MSSSPSGIVRHAGGWLLIVAARTDVIALPPLPSHRIEPSVHVSQISVGHLE